jgi:MFS family permease
MSTPKLRPRLPSGQRRSSFDQIPDLMSPSFSSSVSIHFNTSNLSGSSTANTSFLNSWSSHYINGKIVPPITASTLKQDDDTASYPTRRFSSDYLPYWFLSLSYFTMFIAYSLALNLLTTVFGNSASLALGILYIFFIISSLTTSAINQFVFKNNVTQTAFVGSIGYTSLMFSAIFGSFPLLLCGSIIAGLSGGLVWISYNAALSVMSRYFVEQDFLRNTRIRLHKRLKTNSTLLYELVEKKSFFDNFAFFNNTQSRRDADELTKDPSNPEYLSFQHNDAKINTLVSQLILPNGRVDISKLTDSQSKRIMISTAECISWTTSLGWMINASSSVVGGLISYMMLSPAGPDADPIGAARILFIFFFCCGVLANSIYFLTYKNTPTVMFESNQVVQIAQDDNHINDNIELTDAINDQGDVIYHCQSDLDKAMQRNNSNNLVFRSPKHGLSAAIASPIVSPIPETDCENEDYDSPKLPINTDNVVKSDQNGSDNSQNSSKNIPPVEKISPLDSLCEALFIMSRLLRQRVIYLSIWSWYQTLFPMSLMVSFFTANAVKPTLGTHNVPLIMVAFYFTDSLTAFFVSKLMTGFRPARWFGFCGSIFQLLPISIILAFPHQDWINPENPNNLSTAWTLSLIVAVLSGIGDAVMQSGTASALGIIVEGSVLLRSAGFSLSQISKCTGSVTIFLAARLVSFRTQVWMVCIIICISILFQAINFYFHLPLDVELIMGQFEQFVKERNEKKLQTQPNPAKVSNGTDLDDLIASN